MKNGSSKTTGVFKAADVSKGSFWKIKKMEEMSYDEWESLCDGCSRCCLHKIEEEGAAGIVYTHIVCRYMDMESCRCNVYKLRSRLVPDCVTLKPPDLDRLSWLPQTCAYRLIFEGKDLMWWHPLVSGNPATVFEAGISVRGRVLSEEYVHPDGWYEHVIDWVD